MNNDRSVGVKPFLLFQEQRIEREIKVLREKHVEEEKSKRRAQVRSPNFLREAEFIAR